LPTNYFNSFNGVLDNGVISLVLNDRESIYVCPVPHAGYWGTKNRKKHNGDVLKDWQKIKKYIIK